MQIQTLNTFAGINNVVEPSKLNPAVAVNFINIETSAQTAKSCNAHLDTGDTCEASRYYKRVNFDLWSDKELSVEYLNGYVYHTSKGIDATSVLTRYDTSDESSTVVGFAAPTGSLVITDNANTDYYKEEGFYYAHYFYAITYYNEDTGEESEPLLSAEHPSERVGKTLEIELSNISDYVNCSTFIAAATHIRIYRVGFFNTKFALLDSIPLNSFYYIFPPYGGSPCMVVPALYTYSDQKADTALTTLLETRGTITPPVGLCNLVFHNGKFYASVGSRLRFSKFGNASSWDALNYIDFESNITGMSSINGGLMIFLETKVYMLFGYDTANYNLMTVTGDVGCKYPLSISYFRNMVVWFTYNGLACSDGSNIQYLTKDIYKFSESISVLDSAVVMDSYWLLTDEYLYELDLSNGVEFRIFTVPAGTESLTAFEYDLLLIQDTEPVYKAFKDTTSVQQMTYKSKTLTAPSYLSNIELEKIIITYTGTFEVIIFDNNNEILSSFNISSDIIDIKDLYLKVSNNDVNGVAIQAIGTGEIISISMDGDYVEIENEL